MKFDDYLKMAEAEDLFCGPDSSNYRLYKRIWDAGQKNKKAKARKKKNVKKDK